MRSIFIFPLLLFVQSCKQFKDEWYPPVVLKHGVQHQYDLAVLEMYKANSRHDCTCYGVSSNKELGRDTLNILSLDLEMVYFTILSDTAIFGFNYFKDYPKIGKVQYWPWSKNWQKCQYNEVALVGTSTSAFPTSFGDGYRVAKYPTDSIFEKVTFPNCLEQNQLSTTLKEAIQRIEAYKK